MITVNNLELVKVIEDVIAKYLSSADVAYEEHTAAAREVLQAIEQSGTHTIIPWRVAQTICDVMGERQNAEALKAELDAMLAARPKQEDLG